MIEVKQLVQSTLLVLVLISSLLLGMSMESMRMIAIGVVGAVLGFLVTDCFKLFNIRGFLANVASIVILFLAMKDFFSEDGMGKLVSVANLLVYLQTVLMFQEKTPRLIWQVLVLSLLQVVVAAIFSLSLEAGLLFFVYFVVVGLAMILQSIYTEAFGIQNRNRRSAHLWRSRNQSNQVLPSATSTTENEPIVFFQPPAERQSTFRPLFLQLLMWIAVSAVFTSVLFYLVPRHTRPWFGPTSVKVSSTGVSKAVDLDERGFISQSNELVFRVDFKDRRTGKPVSMDGRPLYFRGLALSNLVIEDGKTNWRAPHDRVFNDVYQVLPKVPSSSNRRIEQTVSLEQTIDPLIYGLMPFYRSDRTPRELLFCHEVSALTRCKSREAIGLAPFSYTAQTLMDHKGNFLEAWPYISNTKRFRQMPMSADPPQREWLVQMDPDRYPSVVGLADMLEEKLAVKYPPQPQQDLGSDQSKGLGEVGPNVKQDLDKITRAADRAGDLVMNALPPKLGGWLGEQLSLTDALSDADQPIVDSQIDEGGIPRLVLLKEMEQYFLEPGRFKYTLDFRNVKRVDRLDPIEDFVRNHRRGHCELFASALTVMLRHKNIPARLVVGFHGGNQNQLSGSYMVRAKNAHAWVEAYLRPQDCSPEMFESGQAGPGGAWLRLDPTPPSPASQQLGVGEDAFELARTAWDDYVLGMENQSTENSKVFNVPMGRFLRDLDVGLWERRFESLSQTANKPFVKYIYAGLILLVFFLLYLRSVMANPNQSTAKVNKLGRLRKLLAGAISLIAPKLGQWVGEGTADSSSVGFYYKMTEILERHNLVRSPSQTHREFASEVSQAFEAHRNSPLISSVVCEVTELFNDVRFGQAELATDLASQVEVSLQELDNALQIEA